MPAHKTWFITGISRGLGKALAQAALARGDTVFGTVRQDAPALPGPGRLHMLRLDMSDAQAVETTVTQAFRQAEGQIDIVVNNAGYGLLGAIEDATDDQMRDLFAVDVFGPVRVIRAALPFLRARGAGHIVNITSIAGRAPGAGSGLYAAAKFALEGLSASLAQEVGPLGIHVTAVAPGAFRTDFLSDHSIRKSAPKDTDAGNAYAGSVGKMAQAFDSMAGKQLGDPARAATAILAAVDADRPPLNLLLGSDAFRRMHTRLDALTSEMTAWESVTNSTDYAD